MTLISNVFVSMMQTRPSFELIIRRLFSGATRPTSARLREALFSMLEAGGMLRSPVLDLYAGSGALGIEALSRGLERCTFVEADGRTCGVIRANLERVGLPGGAVVRGTVGRWQPPA